MRPLRYITLSCLSLALWLGMSLVRVNLMPIPPERVEEVLEMFEGGFLSFEQVSVSMGDEAGSYSFCWVSSIPNTPSVYYMGQQFIGKTFTYQRTGMHGHYTSGNIHKVQISGVPDSSNISYRLAVGETIDGVRSFLTPPKIGPDSRTTIAVVGDWGQTDNSVKTGQHMLDANASITLIAGDLSYADGFQPYWDSWGRMTEALLSSRPFMAAPGNHEIEEDILGENPGRFVAFQTRFRFPSVASGAIGAGNLYYSFNVGAAHVIMLCSYCPFKSGTPQYEWLVGDLKSVDRTLTPWVIAVLHAPWYNSNRAHHNEGEEVQMRAAMERLFYSSKVDLVLAGHVHAYERSFPVFDGHVLPEAPVYITIGDGGNREGLASNYVEPSPVWSAYRLAVYGHGIIDIKNATHLQWEWKRNDAAESATADSFYIVRHDASLKALNSIFSAGQ